MPDMLRLGAGMSTSREWAIALSELKGPFGVADLVVVAGNHEAFRARLHTGVPPLLNQIDALIAATLSSKRGSTPGGLATALNVALPVVERRLAGLHRVGAAERTSDLWYGHDALRPVGRLYAFEAKVDDWRQGLIQALRYQLWTDSATLVLRRLPASPQVVLEAVCRRGLGLAVGSTWLVRPRGPRRRRVLSMWGSEHILAGVLGRPPLRDHESLDPTGKRLYPAWGSKLNGHQSLD